MNDSEKKAAPGVAPADMTPEPGCGTMLRVSALPLDIAEGDVELNLRRARAMLDLMPADTDVAVLPEMFTTAFMKDTDSMLELAVSAAPRTMEALRLWAVEYDCAIAGSIIARNDAGFVNRGFIVLPGEEPVYYDKRHLFCLSPEARLLTPGRELPPVVRFRGWNISLIVCYDLRFPVWTRNTGQQTDLLLVPANWPLSRGYAWRQLLIARAIENQEVVVGADRGGADGFGFYDGMSMIVDPMGVPVAPAPAERPVDMPSPAAEGISVPTDYGEILSARFSLDEVRKLRKRMPVGCDADTFHIHDTDTPQREPGDTCPR